MWNAETDLKQFQIKSTRLIVKLVGSWIKLNRGESVDSCAVASGGSAKSCLGHVHRAVGYSILGIGELLGNIQS
jgi:hypothetical protein